MTALAAAAPANEPRKVITPTAEARAKRIAVNVLDLPGVGWNAGPPRTKSTRVRCSYYNPDQSTLTEDGEYTTPDYTREDGVYVSSTIRIFVSAKQARAAFAAVAQPLLPRCLGEGVAKSSPPPGSVKMRSAGPLSFPRYGDRSAAFRIVFDVKSRKTVVRSALDVVVINRGDVEAAFIFGAGKGAVPASVERRIVGRVAARSATS
jgi:hypothetical protein